MGVHNQLRGAYLSLLFGIVGRVTVHESEHGSPGFRVEIIMSVVVRIAVATTALIFSSTSVAHAASDGSGTGGDVSSPAPSFTQDPSTQDKVAQTLLYGQMRSGKTTPEAFQRAQANYAAKYGFAAPASGSTSTVTAATATTSKSLSLTHYGQNKSYYCGPASGAMMIKMIDGSISSRYDGTGFGQTGIANANHMRTDINGKTGWDSGLFKTGVNRWRGDTFFIQYDSPTATFLKAVFGYSIDNWSRPFAGDTVEFAGGAHYNGHPVNQTIGHWIVAYGYASSGDTGKWADPSTTVWSTANPTFSYSTANFAKFLSTNGIAY